MTEPMGKVTGTTEVTGATRENRSIGVTGETKVTEVTQTKKKDRTDQHLWDLFTMCVEHTTYCRNYSTWEKFMESKIWRANGFFGADPVAWVWLNPKSSTWKDFSDMEDNELTLIWLEYAPLRPRDVKITVHERDEANIRVFLIEQGFLRTEGKATIPFGVLSTKRR